VPGAWLNHAILLDRSWQRSDRTRRRDADPAGRTRAVRAGRPV